MLAKFYPILALTMVAFLSIASLGGLYNLTDEAIAYQRWLRTERMLGEIFPYMDDFTEEYIDNREIFTILYQGVEKGHAFLAEGSGFGGPMTILVGIENELIKGIGIIAHVETPGLGGKITGDEFLGEFVAVNVADVALYPEGTIDGITGATISAEAVTVAVRDTAEVKIELLRGRQ